MLIDALNLMLIGITAVCLFLSLLIISITLIGKIFGQKKSIVVKKPPLILEKIKQQKTEQNKAEIAVAIAIAHTQKKL